jgi:2-polyprenyl-3-methyl-5-hydroxy-6-metoxy-1,4-benzoquinol methylase
MTGDPYRERVIEGEEGFAQHLARYQRANQRIAPGARVLDAGCGSGYGTAALSSNGRQVTGVDRSADAVAHALGEHGGCAHFVRTDVCALPFSNDSFDAVTCFEVIEHVDSPVDLIKELTRVLRPDGVLHISTPNARMERLHARSIGRGANPYHIQPLMPWALRHLLRRFFRDVKLYGQTRDAGSLRLILQSVDVLGLRLALSPHQRAGIARALSRSSENTTETLDSSLARFSRLTSLSGAVLYAEARS